MHLAAGLQFIGFVGLLGQCGTSKTAVQLYQAILLLRAKIVSLPRWALGTICSHWFIMVSGLQVAQPSRINLHPICYQ